MLAEAEKFILNFFITVPFFSKIVYLIFSSLFFNFIKKKPSQNLKENVTVGKNC